MNIAPELQPLYQKITDAAQRLKVRRYAKAYGAGHHKQEEVVANVIISQAEAKRLRKNQHRLQHRIP